MNLDLHVTKCLRKDKLSGVAVTQVYVHFYTQFHYTNVILYYDSVVSDFFFLQTISFVYATALRFDPFCVRTFELLNLC